jgi:hypothetical protein
MDASVIRETDVIPATGVAVDGSMRARAAWAKGVPGCGSADWKKMERALQSWLSKNGGGNLERDWEMFGEEFSRCAVDVDRYEPGPGEFDRCGRGCVRARAGHGGLWLGVLFRREGNDWRVVTAMSGDIP